MMHVYDPVLKVYYDPVRSEYYDTTCKDGLLGLFGNMVLQGRGMILNPYSYAQRLVLAVLLDAAQRGEHLTSRQIGERTATTPIQEGGELRAFGISDPRRTIAHLRERGYDIASEWETNQYGKRFKRYWLADPEQVTAPQQGKGGGDE